MTFNPSAGSFSGSSDVGLNSPSDNQLIGYNAGTGKWTNRNPAIAAITGLQTSLDLKATAASLGTAATTNAADYATAAQGAAADTAVQPNELGSPVLALPAGNAVPAGTASGTIIVRYIV